jgi:putative transposase
MDSARRDCFDHVIALNEAHVRRMGCEFFAYYNDDRTHLGFEKDTPSQRPIEAKPDTGNCTRWPVSAAYNIHLEAAA